MHPSTFSMAAILVGGVGTRLAERTKGIPKCLMTFNDKIFLKMQLDWLKAQGVSQVFLCTGYKSEMIVSAVEKMSFDSPEIHFSYEDDHP